MSGCCSCCVSPFRPRYRRLVDNIFPQNAVDGLVKSNMEKLVFYSLSSPEKLDRIGDYLADRIGRDLSRHRFGFVVIAFEAMDQLLVACHSLNPFVNSYLRVLQLVLECSDPELQLLATKSFVKYANIEEDVPSYHRAYDFFISKFASLCHDNNDDLDKRKKLRIAGLTGVKGLIRKSVTEQIQMDIWKDENMDKIVPSLLFNMHSHDFDLASSFTFNTSMERLNSHSSLSSPPVLAEECLRELVQRATFGQVSHILKPLIKHLDLHKLWQETGSGDKFAISSFKIIMYSIQSQHSYDVVQMLMNHLDAVKNEELNAGSINNNNNSNNNNSNNNNSNNNNNSVNNINNNTISTVRTSISTESPRQRTELIKVRTGIVDVLREIITSDIIGPSILSLINSLMIHLKQSNKNICAKQYTEEEKHFQDSVVDTLGAFAINLPDFQKIEIMIFLIDRAPQPTSTEPSDIQLQKIIMNGLLKVAAKYQVKNMMQTFPSSFLNQLLSRALSPDSGVRITVQKIFHRLLDRHNNLDKLLIPCTLSPLEKVTIEKADRTDLNFIKRYGHDILLNIYQTIELSNNQIENFHSIYTTLALICIEMNNEEVLIDLLRLTFAIQELASHTSSMIDDEHRARIHGLAAGFLHLFSDLKAIPAICAHVERVIQKRQEIAPQLLPEYGDSLDQLDSCEQINKWIIPEVRSSSSSMQGSLENLTSGTNELLFSKSVISEALATTGHDTSALATPFLSRCDVDSSIPRTISDLNAITLEIDSDNSSPGTNRKTLEHEITFKEFKDILMSDPTRDDATIRKKEIVQRFTQVKFEHLVDSYNRFNDNLQDKMMEVIDRSFPKAAEEMIEHCSFSAMGSPMDATKSTRLSNPPTSERDLDQISVATNATPTNSDWRILENPILDMVDMGKISSKGPPLFALRFPDLFVY